MALFTISLPPLHPFASFIQTLKKYGVDTIVDARKTQTGTQLGEYNRDALRNRLAEYKVTYLPFDNEFGTAVAEMERSIHLSAESKEKQYAKTIESADFLHGISRLQNGLARGYHIAILGQDNSLAHSFRARILGRYLASLGQQVFHILPNNSIVGQEHLEETLGHSNSKDNEEQVWTFQIGQQGEQLAALYLMQKGFRILEKNWNLHRGCELDIIAFKANTLHAIEVKTRRSASEVSPEQAIDTKKLDHIIEALHEYCHQKRLFNLNIQVDSIAVVIRNEKEYTIQMYEDVRKRTKKFYN